MPAAFFFVGCRLRFVTATRPPFVGLSSSELSAVDAPRPPFFFLLLVPTLLPPPTTSDRRRFLSVLVDQLTAGL